MTNYDGGRRFEWEVRDHLTANGYDVIRSAGSKTKVDLVGIKDGELVFVQAKRDGKCPPAVRVELLRVAGLVRAVPLVACRPKVNYRRLTGPGPRDWTAWTPDWLDEEALLR